MKYIKIITVSAAFIFALSSCSTTSRIEKDETVDFSKFKTYTWNDIKENADEPKDLVERNLHNTVSAKLGEVEWKEDNTSPDLIIKHDLQVEKKVKQTNNPVYSRSYSRSYYNPYTRRWGTLYYPSRLMGYNNNQYQVNEGTLTITMIDAKTDKVIWQGWNTSELNSKNVTSKEIKSSVKNIFKKFSMKS